MAGFEGQGLLEQKQICPPSTLCMMAAPYQAQLCPQWEKPSPGKQGAPEPQRALASLEAPSCSLLSAPVGPLGFCTVDRPQAMPPFDQVSWGSGRAGIPSNHRAFPGSLVAHLPPPYPFFRFSLPLDPCPSCCHVGCKWACPQHILVPRRGIPSLSLPSSCPLGIWGAAGCWLRRLESGLSCLLGISLLGGRYKVPWSVWEVSLLRESA